MALRICIETGCPDLTPKTRCRLHTKTRHERGYGKAHYAARRGLARSLPTYCGYGCGTWLTGSSDWIAAHRVDGDASAGYLISCRRCNERAKRHD